jgi:hypothetical protein
MRTLIAVVTCHGREYRAKADAQRSTWAKDAASLADVRFFLGAPAQTPGSPGPDEVWLGCGDGYRCLANKVQAMFRWALDAGYDYVWKVDDDVYLRPERLLAIPPHDYCGIGIMPGRCVYPYLGTYKVCEGGAYGLGSKALRLLAACPAPAPRDEDVWVGCTLDWAGIAPVHLGIPDAKITSPVRKGHPRDPRCPYPEPPPAPENEVAASYEYSPAQMAEIHRRFKGGL